MEIRTITNKNENKILYPDLNIFFLSLLKVIPVRKQSIARLFHSKTFGITLKRNC